MLWAVIHVYLLVNFQKRILVTMQWLWRWATHQRGARLITADRPAPVTEAVTSSHGQGAEPFRDVKRGQG